MKLSCQPSPIQSHYYRTPGFFANNENFLGSQFAREEHNASFDFDKVWADHCPPISPTTLLTSCKNVVYLRYHAAKVAMFSESAKRINEFLWLATKIPLQLWWRGKYQKNKDLSGCFCLYVNLLVYCINGLKFKGLRV